MRFPPSSSGNAKGISQWPGWAIYCAVCLKTVKKKKQIHKLSECYWNILKTDETIGERHSTRRRYNHVCTPCVRRKLKEKIKMLEGNMVNTFILSYFHSYFFFFPFFDLSFYFILFNRSLSLSHTHSHTISLSLSLNFYFSFFLSLPLSLNFFLSPSLFPFLSFSLPLFLSSLFVLLSPSYFLFILG